jgi:hypothetical protein
MPAKEMTARRIVSATEVRSTFPGSATAGVGAPGNMQMIGGSPLPDNLEILSSSIALDLLIRSGVSATNANEHWYMGDFPRCFYWMENWPFTIQQAPANNIKDFEQDILMRWKGSFRGVCATIDPRHAHRYRNQA